MKKALVAALAVAGLAMAQMSFAEEGKAEKKSAKTSKYEVVDVACFVAKGEKGEKHKECAMKCISGGGELALLSNGKLYIPVDKDFKSARDKFVSKGGDVVDVAGKKISKGGVNYLQIE